MPAGGVAQAANAIGAAPSPAAPDAPTPAGVLVRGAAKGILDVAVGQTALRVVGILGSVVLARLLSPGDFGIYGLTAFVVYQFGAIADLGLGTKLIHNADEPTVGQQRAIFTVQVVLAICIYALVLLLAPFISRVCSLGSDGVRFCRVSALIIPLFPFRAIPSAMLNRRLRFRPIALSELVGGIVFQGLAIFLAWRGWSYWSFGYALLVSTCVRTAILHVSFPWQIGFGSDLPFVRASVKFGGAFQLSSLTAVFRDNIVSFLGGPMFGPTAVGLLSWAYRIASYCSQSYVAICANVSFPSLSRIRGDQKVFSQALSKMIRYVNIATLLTISVIVGLAPQLIHIVFTDKWLPALPLLYCFAIRMVAANYTTLLDLALKAQGRPEKSLQIMTCWAAWEWAGAVGLSLVAGFTGIAIASAIFIWPTVIWLYREVRKATPLPIIDGAVAPLAAGAATIVLLRVLATARIHGLWSLIPAAAAAALAFLAICLPLSGVGFSRELWADVLLLVPRRPAASAVLVSPDQGA